MAIFKRVKDFLYANRKLMLLTIPFWTMDLVIRILGYKIDYYQAYMPIPNLFTLIYVMLFMGIASSVKGNAGKIIYGIFFLIKEFFCQSYGVSHIADLLYNPAIISFHFTVPL